MPVYEIDRSHRVNREHYTQTPLDVSVSLEDKRTLRELAGRLAEIGSLPIQEKRKSLWTRLNRLEADKPMVWLNDVCWNEMEVDHELGLTTSSPFCRRIEAELRQTLYQWKHMPGDMVVEPVVYAPLAVRNSGIGVEIEEDILATDETNTVVSHRYRNMFETEEDIEKIQTPTISHDVSKSEENLQAYRDIFDGVVAVEQRGAPGFSFSPWDDLIELTGAEPALFNLAARPDFMHRIVDRITTAYIQALDQYETQNLLSLNNTNIRIGSGAYGYTDELPRADFDREHVRCVDLWGSATAQIFSEVSPEMHEEFALNYERRWLERFGLTYYGCCEPLYRKMHLLRKVPNLRKVSVSPWNDMEKMAEELSGDYVFSLKPSPAILATDSWDPETVRKELDETLRIALKHGCNVEIIMKDISTVRYQPQRLWQWAEIASEVTDRLADHK